MYGDRFDSVRKSSFDLNFMNHFGLTFHYIFVGKNGSAIVQLSAATVFPSRAASIRRLLIRAMASG